MKSAFLVWNSSKAPCFNHCHGIHNHVKQASKQGFICQNSLLHWNLTKKKKKHCRSLIFSKIEVHFTTKGWCNEIPVSGKMLHMPTVIANYNSYSYFISMNYYFWTLIISMLSLFDQIPRTIKQITQITYPNNISINIPMQTSIFVNYNQFSQSIHILCEPYLCFQQNQMYSDENPMYSHMLSSAIITWSNITWYCIHHCSDWGRA